MIHLETERLILRNLKPTDAEVMYDYRNDIRCSRHQRGQIKDLPGIRELIYKRMDASITDQDNFVVAVERKDAKEMIGEIVVMPNDGCFSLGYTFHYAHHRQGYAYEALSLLVNLLHERYPQMEFISFTEPENTASMALLRKLGYADLGYSQKVESQVFGKWLQDEDWQ